MTSSWNLLLALAAMILLSLFGRNIQSTVLSLVGPQQLSAVVFSILALILSGLYYKRKTLNISLWKIVVAVLFLFSAIFAVYQKYLLPVEAVHFLLFTWIGWACVATFGLSYGVMVLVSVAVGDEVLQHFLQDRVGDFHDVAVNLVSAGIGALLRGKP